MTEVSNIFVTFNNKVKFPLFGIGTYTLTNDQDIANLRQMIVEGNYRHIDTASRYRNEEKIGEILEDIFKTTQIRRSDIFVTTKAFFHETHDLKNAIKESLKKLKLEYDFKFELLKYQVNLSFWSLKKIIKKYEIFSLTDVM